MRITDKTKRIICITLAVALILPIAISVVSMFIA